MTKAKTLSPAETAKLVRFAAGASVCVALTLIVAKLVAWFMTDSIALLSSLIDSMLDAVSSGIMFFAVRLAHTPADAHHRFGHGNAEAIAALAQAALITGSAIFLIIEAVHRLIEPAPVSYGAVGMGVMGFSIIMTLGLTQLQRYVVKRTGSVAIESDQLHYLTDLLTNAAVLIALALAVYLGWGLADPLFAIVLGVFIFYSAWEIGKKAMDMLMDKELPADQQARIVEIATAHSEVFGVHDLRTRRSGPRIFIQLHIEMDGNMTLNRAHAIADTVEAELSMEFPQAEIILHQDPPLLDEERAGFAHA